VLIITRRPGEKIMLGDDVVIEVIEVSGSSVRVGIAAPKSIPVYREEIWRSVKEERASAAAMDPENPGQSG
jgi:carbon storage regulator